MVLAGSSTNLAPAMLAVTSRLCSMGTTRLPMRFITSVGEAILGERVLDIGHHRLAVVVPHRTSPDGVALELEQPSVELVVADTARCEPLEATVVGARP